MANKKIAGVLAAYVAGQATQLVIHGVVLANNMYNYRQIPFCLAGGFVILFAVLCGVWIATAKADKPAHEKKTYLDWAKIPEEDIEVIDPFEVVTATKKESKNG